MSSFLKSFSYAFKGIASALKQRNMKIIFVCAILTIAAAWGFGVTDKEWCILLICIGGVISLEMMNCAIEGIVDLVHPQHGEKAGRIKDVAAGAVLVFSFISLIIGVLILGKYFLFLIYILINK